MEYEHAVGHVIKSYNARRRMQKNLFLCIINERRKKTQICWNLSVNGVFITERMQFTQTRFKNKISLLGYIFIIIFEKETLKPVAIYLAKKYKPVSDKNFNRGTEVQSIIQ